HFFYNSGTAPHSHTFLFSQNHLPVRDFAQESRICTVCGRQAVKVVLMAESFLACFILCIKKYDEIHLLNSLHSFIHNQNSV
ncbi:hypothetical protein AB205_0029640, partial [Aquarana catesbeiana]